MALQQLVDACGWALLHSVWQIAAMAFLLAVVLRATSSERCNGRYLSACVAMVLMIVAVAATFVWEMNASSAPTAVRHAHEDNEGTLPLAITSAGTSAVESTNVPLVAPGTRPSGERLATQVESTSWRTAIESWLAPWIASIVALWIVGVSLLSLRLCANWLAVGRLRESGGNIEAPAWTRALTRLEKRLSIGRTVALLQSSAAVVPMVIGWLKPVVLVPMELVSGLTSVEIEAILAHELAHIRRHDYLANLLQNVVETFLFYHPAVWWVSRQIRREREFCCDDIAAQLCEGTAAYARALATVETMRNLPPALSVAATGGSLLDRIRRLAGREPKQAVGASGMMAGVLLVSLVILLMVSFAGQTAKGVPTNSDAMAEQADTIRVSGRVVDGSGKPVSGALVTFPYYHDQQVKAESTHTAASGAFTLEIPRDRKKNSMQHVWAYAQGYGIRAVNLAKLLRDAHELKDVEIRLPPAEPLTYRVLLPDGSPCIGAVVCPFMIQVPNGVYAADEPTGLGHWLPDDITKIVSQNSSDNGEVTFDQIPKALVSSVAVTTPEFGEQRFWKVEGDLQLLPVGSIEGKLETDDTRRFVGTKVYIHTGGGIDRVEGVAMIELNEEGKFAVPKIAAGELELSMAWDSKSAVLPHLRQPHGLIHPGETLRVTIDTRPAIKVTGRILTEDSRVPARNAKVHVRNLDSPYKWQDVVTDAEGQFEARAFSGLINIQVASFGDDKSFSRDYDYPRIGNQEVPNDVAEHSLGDIFLPLTKRFNGVLLSATGSPRAGAEIGVGIEIGAFRHVAEKTTTNKDGAFEIRVRNWEDLDREYGLKWVELSPTKSPMETPPMTTLQVVSEEPLVLQERDAEQEARVAPPAGFRHMAVRTVDEAGKPVSNTRIFVNVGRDEDRKYKTSNENYFTNEKGETVVLVPDPPRLFRVWTQKDGYVPLFANWEPEWQADGDQIPDEFTFTLPSGTKVGGTIVNDKGIPIEGATVEVMLVGNPGDEMRERPVESIWLAEVPGPGENPCVTDAEGRWSLNNVPEGDDVQVRVKLTHPDYISDTNWGSLQGEQQVTMESLRNQTAKIAMHSGPMAKGTVTDADGKPVADALVIWGDDPYMQEGSQEVHTNAEGVYELSPLTPGVYAVTVVAEGWRPELSIVEIKPEMGPHDFQLHRGTALRVKFVDENGDPIPDVYVGIREWRGKQSLYNHRHPNVLDTRIPLQADKEGIYEWTWAPPDGVKYSFGKKGYQGTESILIADGEEYVVELERE